MLASAKEDVMLGHLMLAFFFFFFFKFLTMLSELLKTLQCQILSRSTTETSGFNC